MVERAIDRALKSLHLIVQSGVCTMVAIDLIDIPVPALRRLPSSTWFRIERIVENTEIAVVLCASTPIARSKGGRSLSLGADVRWSGEHERSRRFAGVQAKAVITAAHWSQSGAVVVNAKAVNGG
jgi:hypothetical protein